MQRLDLAKSICKEVGQEIRDTFWSRNWGTMKEKSRQDLVTETDLKIEKEIRRKISEVFPEDFVLGEEQGGSTGEGTWLVDPIDGTYNFFRGIPYLCVSMAYHHSREGLQIGVIYDPIHDELYWSEKGNGSFCNDSPIKVSNEKDPSKCFVGCGLTAYSKDKRFINSFEKLKSFFVEQRQLGAAALSLAHISCGRLDAFYEFSLKPWDVAAGMLLVKEAGGIVWEYDLFSSKSSTEGAGMVAGSANFMKWAEKLDLFETK